MRVGADDKQVVFAGECRAVPLKALVKAEELGVFAVRFAKAGRGFRVALPSDLLGLRVGRGQELLSLTICLSTSPHAICRPQRAKTVVFFFTLAFHSSIHSLRDLRSKINTVQS